MACLCAGPALAQEPTGTLKKIKDTGTITLGHRESSLPFSYYDDRQQVVGYAMDLCARIVDGVKTNLKLAKLEAKLNPVTSATRIPLDGERHRSISNAARPRTTSSGRSRSPSPSPIS